MRALPAGSDARMKRMGGSDSSAFGGESHGVECGLVFSHAATWSISNPDAIIEWLHLAVGTKESFLIGSFPHKALEWGS